MLRINKFQCAKYGRVVFSTANGLTEEYQFRATARAFRPVRLCLLRCPRSRLNQIDGRTSGRIRRPVSNIRAPIPLQRSLQRSVYTKKTATDFGKSCADWPEAQLEFDAHTAGDCSRFHLRWPRPFRITALRQELRCSGRNGCRKRAARLSRNLGCREHSFPCQVSLVPSLRMRITCSRRR